jgi:plastocyanin
MLHHIVFSNLGTSGDRRDGTCSAFTMLDSKTQLPALAERFYAAGEERAQLKLPDGYGYPVKGTDNWLMTYMLMNHRNVRDKVYIQYHVTYDTSPGLTPVTPYWLDVRNCRADPVFNVPGTGGTGSTYQQRADWVAPQSGILVAGGGHLHGGGISVDVSDTSCGSLYTSYPTWGGIEPRPVMHEPGPTAMTGFSDATGRPIRAGDTLRITATYDNARPHVRAMGIAILYFTPQPVATCGSYTSPVPAPTRPERVAVALLKQPVGPVTHVTSTWVGDYTFGAQRVSIRRGTRFTWRFIGRVAHDVTLASGPVGFSSPSVSSGTFSYRFTRPGTYRLFCSLHPALMTQVVRVR